MLNIDQIKPMVDLFYNIKNGITLDELYTLFEGSTKEDIDAEIAKLIEAEEIKKVGDNLVPFETI